MNRLLSNLDLFEVEQLKSLAQVAANLQDKTYFNLFSQIIRYYTNFKVYPDDDFIKQNFPSFQRDIREFLTDKLYSSIEAGLRNMWVREQLIILSSDTTTDLDKLQNVIDSCKNGVCTVPSSAVDFDGKKAYLLMKNKPAGMKFFVNSLDSEVMGMSYGTITTIFGFVASLKTTFATSIGYLNKMRLNYNIAHVTLESSKNKQYFSYMARHAYELDQTTKITSKRIVKADLTDEEISYLFDHVEPDFKEKGGKLFILERTDLIGSDGHVSERSFKLALDRISDKCDLDAFIVDYINLMKYFRSSGGEGVNTFVSFLEDLAITYKGKGLIGIQLAQANREGWKRACKKGGAYTIDALAEFNELERSSSMIVPLFYDDSLRASGEVKMQLIKHRDGDVINEPFTTYAQPESFFIGDLAEYSKVFSEETLEDSSLFADNFEE